jgi:hypothetical protein
MHSIPCNIATGDRQVIAEASALAIQPRCKRHTAMQACPRLTVFQKALVTVFMVLLSVLPVHALDGKNYPGSMCVRWSGTSTPIYNFSAIGNPSATTDLRLDCPVIKDATNISSGWVRVIDQHYSDNVGCNLNSLYRSGGSYVGWWTPWVSSVGSSGNPQHLGFGSVGANSLTHYYYSCRIPPTYGGNLSYITSYNVTEN